MDAITLTPHQHAACDWLVQQILQGEKLIAMRGLAGTGKTALIPVLQARLEAVGLPVAVGAPTHRATMILRKKGIAGAETVHAHALTPYFTPDYTRAAAWLGELLPLRLATDEADTPHEDLDGLPWLVWQAVEPDLARGRGLKRLVGRHKARRLLASIGVSGKDHFAGFGPKAGQGVLIIDEASMVGTAMLATCQEAFPQIILIGDPGQLPPVKDEAILPTVPGVDLTEVHRQAANSPILGLAYRARQGETNWQSELTASALGSGDAIQVGARAEARRFLQAPLLVWRNDTRLTCTHAIRQALGYRKTELYVGEPLVCRSTSPEDRVMGFYNNGLYTIMAIDPDHPRRVTLVDALGETETIIAHLEEIDGKDVDPKAIPFRFGYALTAHTAQGGEWPTVYVSLPDLWLYVGQQLKRGRAEEVAQWTYTVITRAKDTLQFLTHHTFTGDDSMANPNVAPPSAPMFASKGDLTQDASETPQDAPELIPGIPDDIPDPPLPTSLQTALQPDPTWVQHEALLQGALQALMGKIQPELTQYLKHAEAGVDDVMKWCRAYMETEAEKLHHARHLFDEVAGKIAEQGLQVRHDPYTAEVQARTPQGFLVTIKVAHSERERLMKAVPALLAWMETQQFGAVEAGMPA